MYRKAFWLRTTVADLSIDWERHLGGEWRVKGKERKVLDVGGVERQLGAVEGEEGGEGKSQWQICRWTI
jgi:hypothetical protein